MTDHLKTRRPRRRPAAPTTPDPVEIAMEAEASGEAPTGEASALLRRQSQLIAEQIGLARNERFRNRIKAVRDITLAAAVLLLMMGLGTVLWSARQAQGLVLEPFAVPPSMVANGIDGSVVAARLLDRLSTMQAGTDSSRAPATFGNNWGDDLAVEVPETGLSAGEIWRMLRQNLGDETRLSGDLTEAGGRLTLTTRVGSNPGVVVSGGPDELEGLLDRAAEAVYRQTQPYRYSVWISRTHTGGNAELLAELAASGDPTEQLWARVGLSVNAYRSDPGLSLALAREALALDPTFHKARWNVSDALAIMGEQETELHERRLIERAMRRRDQRVTQIAQDQVLHDARARIAEYVGDYATMVAERRVQGTLPDYSGNAHHARYEAALGLLALHDGAAARAALAAADRSVSKMPEQSAIVRALAASERDQHASAAAFVRTALAINDDHLQLGWLPEDRASMAFILALAGDRAAAEAQLSMIPPACYPCLVARGRIAALDGDSAGAERLLIRAAMAGPSLPFAWQALGLVKLNRLDPAGAIRAFSEAAQRGPRWADPLKYWGDALLAQGDERGAIRKYQAAARFAPNWGALNLAWGRVLEAEGRRDEALVKYRAAAGMDLSAAERGEMVRRVAGASTKP